MRNEVRSLVLLVVLFFGILTTLVSALTIDFDSSTDSGSKVQSSVFVNLTTADSGAYFSFVDFNSDLNLWYHMDEVDGSGNPYDNSSRGLHGTKLNGATQSSGKFGSGFHFPGGGNTDTAINTTSSLQEVFQKVHTISFWTNSSDGNPSGNQQWMGSIASDNNAWIYLSIRTNGAIQYFYRSDSSNVLSGTTSAIFDDGPLDWTHIVVTANNSSANALKIYVDGSEVYSAQDGSGVDFASWTSDSPLYLGAYNSKNTGIFGEYAGSMDEFMLFNRTLTATEVLALYNSSATQYENNFTGLSEGTYNYTGYIVNATGAVNNSSGVTILDFTSPSVTINSPTPITYTDNNVFFNITLSESGSSLYSVDGGATNFTMVTSDSLVYNSTYIAGDGNTTVTFFFNDSAGNRDLRSVEFNVSTTPPNVTVNLPVNVFNTSSQSVDFNFTTTDESSSTLNCSVYIDEVYNLSNTSTINNTLTNLNVVGITEGAHNWSVNCTNSAGNFNISTTRNFTVDLLPPTASSLIYTDNTYTDNSTDDVDPNVELTFNVTVSDSSVSVSTVILQYHNGTLWANSTMTSPSSDGNYNTTVSLGSIESNYTYNIWSNDSLGNNNESTNLTFDSSWDCSWNATSDLGTTAGWDENKFIGNVTINNTGDLNYSNNNCTLEFLATYDLDPGRIYYAGESFKNLNFSNLPAGTSSVYDINATFKTEVDEENVVITLVEYRGRSTVANDTVTATVVSNQASPYLTQTLTTTASNVYLSAGNFTLEGYLRNLMGSSTFNDTLSAYNVTFNWTLPGGFTNISGNTTSNFSNLTDNDLHYNNLNVSFSDLASMTSGAKTFYLTAHGYKLSGGLISNANSETILNNSVVITFLCNSTSDGVLVSACGSLDGDYVAPATTTTTTEGGGGGGGGGGTASKTETLSSTESLQVVRGKQNEIKVPFKNTDSLKPITDISIGVTGDISRYIVANPKNIPFLAPGQEINITLEIVSPTYIDIGAQEITILITGTKGTKNYRETKKLILEIHELSGKDAKNLLTESQRLIEQLKKENITTEDLSNLLNKSEIGIKSFNYELVRDNHKIIKNKVSSALSTNEIVEELTELIQVSEEKGIKVDGSSRLLKLAVISLDRGEFEQAYERAKDAQISYALEVKGEFGKISYYLENYPGKITLAAFFMIFFNLGVYNGNKLRVIKKRIRQLKEEELMLGQLMQAIQKETFKENKMSMDEYKTAMGQYQRKLSETIESLIELESKRVYALRFSSKNKRLLHERDEIIKLVKILQNDYLKEGKVESKSYEIRLESYNRRLTIVEESLALLEAKQAFKGGWKFWEVLKIPKEKRL